MAIVSGAKLPWLVMAALAIPLAWSPDPIGGFQLWWAFTMLAVLAVSAPLDLTKVYWAIGIGLCINTTFALLQWIGYEPVTHVGDGWSISGLFFNKSPQNNFIALAVIGLVMLKDWRAYCIAAWAAIPMLGPPSISRGPLAALGVAGLVMLWRRNRWLAAALGFLAFLALMVAIGWPGRVSSNVERLTTWYDMLQHITLIGNGLGSFRWAYPEMEFAHNDLFQVAYEFGVPGLAAFMLLAFIALRYAGPTEQLILIAFFVEGSVAFPLYWPATSFVAALCVGSALRRRYLFRPVLHVQRVNHAGKVVAQYAA